MSMGKTAAQAAHAAQKVFFDKFKDTLIEGDDDEIKKGFCFIATEEEIQYVRGRFTKIVKKVKNENQLISTYQKALEAGLNCSLIKDAGLTELVGENYTAVCIGPNYEEDCMPIVKRLRNL